MITELERDIVKLSETADVVSLMLQFMHNQVQPDCDKMESSLLLDFTKAAEKYGMYPAFEACKKGMRARTSSRPLEALLLKSTYDIEGIDTVVRQTLNMPVEQVLFALNNSRDIFILWSLYREKWRTTFPAYQELVSSGPTTQNYRTHNATNTCLRRKLFETISIFLENEADPSVEKVDRVVSACRKTLSCPRCSIVESDSDWDEWRARVAESINGLPKWSEFL
ncbi:hypothetical protein D9758_005572 [Tetrapyrgos nigripes]|uniref:Uncharacterized protein n=1 Tax=Tetrapyrgos nigripes TaxID=182062 RepID=A0A8H5GGZ7_9AGAR|nr:hypothetical protein D9758_005572 [Tetrapyrgos nigripes]